MRVTVLTVGSRGDVQPLVALADGLKEAGHCVTVGTHERFRTLVERNGLGFSPLEGNPRELLESQQGLAWLEAGSNRLRAARHLMNLARPLVAGLVRDALTACRSAEVIVFSGIGMVGYHVAEAVGVPCLLAALAPASRSRYFPDIGAPTLPLGPAYNFATHLVAEQFAWQPLRRLVNEQRRAVLGLAPLPLQGPLLDPEVAIDAGRQWLQPDPGPEAGGLGR